MIDADDLEKGENHVEIKGKGWFLSKFLCGPFSWRWLDAWAVLRNKSVVVRFKEDEDDINKHTCKCDQCKNPTHDGICSTSAYKQISRCGCDGTIMCSKHDKMFIFGNDEEHNEAIKLQELLLELKRNMRGI